MFRAVGIRLGKDCKGHYSVDGFVIDNEPE